MSKLSCTNCQTYHCRHLNGGTFPNFCLTRHTDKDLIQDTISMYTGDGEDALISNASVSVEGAYRGQLTRVEETIAFAKRLNVKKVGIATCIGLIEEAKIFAKMLENHDFEVYGVSCKIGAVDKTALNIEESHKINPGCHESLCNPILQAKLLNEEQTDLNVIIGLCVGHDSLFIKHSDSLVTTLIVKDRVLGHNPVAALYTSHSFYKKLMNK